MCLVGLRLGRDDAEGVCVIANRDEFHARPTAHAAFWDDAPNLLAGRDLEAGGTWLGVTRTGRWAAVTNFRSPTERDTSRRSRGPLVRDFLLGTTPAREYATRVLEDAHAYHGFNLLLGERSDVHYVSSVLGAAHALAPGEHALSNHHLGTPWPKTIRLLDGLRRTPDDATDEAWLTLLSDRTPAPDASLPDTGVGLGLERVLAPAFVLTPTYGTRASTVLRIDATGIRFTERSFAPDGTSTGTLRFRLP